MRRKLSVLVPVVFFLTLLCNARSLFAQDFQTVGASTLQVTITARAKHGSSPVPALTAEDVTVHEDRSPRPIVSLVPLSQAGSPLQLVILIDENSSIRLGGQFQEVSQFVQTLPQSANVAVAYALNGSAQIRQPFTIERAAISNALHITFGPSAGNTSIYSAFSDLIRRWPDASGNRNVLLLSDGVDPTYGFANTEPSQNQGLQAAVREAQKAHVTVFSIFVSSGRITANQVLNLNGQSSLGVLTSETGGYFFSQGTQTPVSFHPFLNDLSTMLGQQYLLTFRAASASKPGFHDLKVNTETSGVKLLTPNRIFSPPSQ